MVRLGIFYFILGIDISSTHSFYKKNNITTFSAINIYYTFIIIAFCNGDFKNKGIFKIAQNVGKALIETFTTVFATLSITIPITFLLKNSTGEKTASLLIALAFMIAFALSSFFPAIIYYREMKNTSKNEKKASFH